MSVIIRGVEMKLIGINGSPRKAWNRGLCSNGTETAIEMLLFVNRINNFSEIINSNPIKTIIKNKFSITTFLIQ